MFHLKKHKGLQKIGAKVRYNELKAVKVYRDKVGRSHITSAEYCIRYVVALKYTYVWRYCIYILGISRSNVYMQACGDVTAE